MIERLATGIPPCPPCGAGTSRPNRRSPQNATNFFFKRPLRDGPDGQAVVGLLPHSICWGRWDAVDVGSTHINGSEATQFTIQQAVQWSSRGARWRLEFRNRTSAGPALDRGACCCWCCGGGGAELQNRTPPRPKNLEQNTPSMRSVLWFVVCCFVCLVFVFFFCLIGFWLICIRCLICSILCVKDRQGCPRPHTNAP